MARYALKKETPPEIDTSSLAGVRVKLFERDGESFLQYSGPGLPESGIDVPAPPAVLALMADALDQHLAADAAFEPVSEVPR
jgi:hypothetical protein